MRPSEQRRHLTSSVRCTGISNKWVKLAAQHAQLVHVEDCHEMHPPARHLLFTAHVAGTSIDTINGRSTVARAKGQTDPCREQ